MILTFFGWMDLVRKTDIMNEGAKIFQIGLGSGLIRAVRNKTCELNVKTNMVRWCCSLLFAALPCLCFCQIGLNVRYLFGKSEILDLENISQDGIHASVEYNLRLKEKRVEFRPGVGYRFTSSGSKYDGNIRSFDFDLGQLFTLLISEVIAIVLLFPRKVI